jgi:hypothetical protein
VANSRCGIVVWGRYGNSAKRRPAPATGWRMHVCFCTYQTRAATGWTTGTSRSSSTGTTSTTRQAPEPSSGKGDRLVFRSRRIFALLRSAWGSLRSNGSASSPRTASPVQSLCLACPELGEWVQAVTTLQFSSSRSNRSTPCGSSKFHVQFQSSLPTVQIV